MKVAIQGLARGGRAVLGPMEIEVGPTEAVAILGPSGIGKTSLLRLIAGLEVADGAGVTGAGRVAMVFQEPTLLPWRSVRDNIRLATGCDTGEAGRLIAAVGLEGREDAVPRALSLGQQRRVAIARAFAARPDTLLLDEPFVSLDAEVAERMQALLAALIDAHPVRVLMVTHARAEALALADRVLTIEGQPGRLGAQTRLDRPRAERDAGWIAAEAARLDTAAQPGTAAR